MMGVINRDQHQTTSVPARNALSVIASANSTDSIVRLGDSIGDPKQGTTAIATSDTAASRVKPRLRSFSGWPMPAGQGIAKAAEEEIELGAQHRVVRSTI
jgi:hypothetical protein